MGGMDWLTTGFSFVAVFLMTYGSILILGRRHAIKKRIRNIESPASAIEVLRLDVTYNPLKRRLINWVSYYLKRFGFKEREELSKFSILLTQGGFRQPHALYVLYGLKAMGALVLPLPFLLFIIIKNRVTLETLGIAFLIAWVGYLLPQLILRKIVKRRQERIDKALPDVLDLLIICMEAGLSLQATITRVAEEIRSVCEEFHSELTILSGEIAAGLSLDVALKNLAQRTGVQSVQSLVTLIVQSEKLGASMVQSLRTQSDFARNQRILRTEERAAKMAVKILMPMIIFIFPTMFVVTIGPGAIRLFKTVLPSMH